MLNLFRKIVVHVFWRSNIVPGIGISHRIELKAKRMVLDALGWNMYWLIRRDCLQIMGQFSKVRKKEYRGSMRMNELICYCHM